MSDGVSKRMGNLSPEKQALLVLQMKKKKAVEAAAAARAAAAMPRRATSGPAPLSFAQQRLWLLDRLEPGSTAYSMPFALTISGRLDVAALERSFSEVVRRHEILRTTFPAAGGRPQQRIGAAWETAIPVIDLRHLAPAEREAAMGQIGLAEAERPFDLARAPLVEIVGRGYAGDHLAAVIVDHHDGDRHVRSKGAGAVEREPFERLL